jgi:paraquat-inducible protein B
VAALIGGWLIVKAYYEKGPVITITFKSAEGLEAGKTKIKFKDVEIGLLEEIRLGEDLSHVQVRAQLVKEAGRFLSENTRFWVVRARVSASAIRPGDHLFRSLSTWTRAGANRPAASSGWKSRPS